MQTMQIFTDRQQIDERTVTTLDGDKTGTIFHISNIKPNIQANIYDIFCMQTNKYILRNYKTPTLCC